VRVEVGIVFSEFFCGLDLGVNELRVIFVNIGVYACYVKDKGACFFEVNVLAQRNNELSHIIEKRLDMSGEVRSKVRELSFVGRNGEIAESCAIGRGVNKDNERPDGRDFENILD